MKKTKKSIVFIKNGYCCGHGQIVYRLVNYLKTSGIEYKIDYIRDKSTAEYDGTIVELSPTKTLDEVLINLGL